MTVQRKSVSFPDISVEQIEGFPSAYHGGVGFSTKVQEMLRDLTTQLSRAQREIEPMLTEAEWNYIRDMLNSTVLTGELAYRFILPAQVEEADECEGLGEKWGVDVPVLVAKLRGLSEFQAYAVAKAADAFWSRKQGEE